MQTLPLHLRRRTTGSNVLVQATTAKVATRIISGTGGLVVAGGPGVMAGVAQWSIDPAAADRLWEYALPVIGA